MMLAARGSERKFMAGIDCGHSDPIRDGPNSSHSDPIRDGPYRGFPPTSMWLNGNEPSCIHFRSMETNDTANPTLPLVLQ